MFNPHDKVYIKKYCGNYLKADTNHTYEIIDILQTKNCIHDNTIFEKRAMLNNGKEYVIYTYNIITEKREYYMEKKPPWYSKFLCCV